MEFIIYIILILLIAIQSIMGVGVLVIGTPLMLIAGYNFISILQILLPISILTSLLNIIIIKFYYKKNIFKYKNIILKNFFLICAPSIFFGIFFLKIFRNDINFGIIVSIIIIISLFTKLQYNKEFKKISKKFYKWLISFLGIIHGLTNSGGTILLLIMETIIPQKEEKRYIVSIFYFLLAAIQYLIFIFFFDTNIDSDLIVKIVIVLPLGIILGNLIYKKINNKVFSNIINLVIGFSAISLLIKSI